MGRFDDWPDDKLREAYIELVQRAGSWSEAERELFEHIVLERSLRERIASERRASEAIRKRHGVG